MSNILFEINNLSKSFGQGEAKVRALQNINFKINEGELIAITGPSGCGKSTLLNVIAGLIKSNEGSILFKGEDILKWSNTDISEYRNKNIGYIMQNFGLINSLSIIKNVLLPIKKAKERKEKKKIALSRLKSLGILEKEKSYPHELSGGQRQRVAIARALMNNPKVILADEPTGSLDLKNSQMIMDILKDINKNGTTVLLVTHQKELADQCDRYIELEDGRIISDKIKWQIIINTVLIGYNSWKLQFKQKIP